jgi:hypothetical protein
MHGTNSDAAERQQACAMMPYRPAKRRASIPLLEPGAFGLSENAVQRAVKVYSGVEEIEVNTDDCAANRPAGPPLGELFTQAGDVCRVRKSSIAKRAKRERNLLSAAKIKNDKRN